MFAPFDKEEIFGKRHGVDYSPHIKTQVDLDTKLLWLIGGLTVAALMTMGGTLEETSALRLNYRMTNMGRITVDDLVEKKL